MLVFLDSNGYECRWPTTPSPRWLGGLAQHALECDPFRRWLVEHRQPIASALERPE